MDVYCHVLKVYNLGSASTFYVKVEGLMLATIEYGHKEQDISSGDIPPVELPSLEL